MPADAYYGIHTVRAMETFRVSGNRLHPALIVATAQVKLAAAQANTALGRLNPTLGDAIAAAAIEGLNNQPVNGNKTPAAIGIPIIL